MLQSSITSVFTVGGFGVCGAVCCSERITFVLITTCCLDSVITLRENCNHLVRGHHYTDLFLIGNHIDWIDVGITRRMLSKTLLSNVSF